jgi:hypothetical protein
MRMRHPRLQRWTVLELRPASPKRLAQNQRRKSSFSSQGARARSAHERKLNVIGYMYSSDHQFS